MEVRLWRQSNRLVAGAEGVGGGRDRASPARTCSGGSRCTRRRTTRSRRGRCTRPTAARSRTATPSRATCATRCRPSSASSRCSSSGGRPPSIDSTQWIAEAAKQVDGAFRPDAHARLPAPPRLRAAEEGPGAGRHPTRARRARRGRRRPDRLLRGARRARDRAVRVRHRAGLAARAPEPRAARGGPDRLPRWSSAARCSTSAAARRSRWPTTSSRTCTCTTPRASPRCGRCSRGVPGVGEVLDEDGKREYGLDHPRSGELVLIAEPDAWFTYYYWLDDDKAPGLRAHRRHPPQARLRPGRAVPRPGDPRAAARDRLAAGAQEARLPHADGRDPARRVAGARARTGGSRTTRRRARC